MAGSIDIIWVGALIILVAGGMEIVKRIKTWKAHRSQQRKGG